MNDLIFRSRRDKSNNIYYLFVDLEKKELKSGFNMGFSFYDDSIETYKKSLDLIQAKFEAAGFTTQYI